MDRAGASALASLIREEREPILADWRSRLRALEAAGEALPADLVNAGPAVLDRLAAAAAEVAEGRAPAPRARSANPQHPARRRALEAALSLLRESLALAWERRRGAGPAPTELGILERLVDDLELTSASPHGRAPISEERFRAVVEALTDHGIFLLDPAGRVVGWPEPAARMLGWSDEQVLGRSWDALFPPEVAEAERRSAMRLDAAAALGRVEATGEMVRADGSRFFAAGSITPVLPGGELEGFVVVLRDVSAERRAAEAQAILLDAGKLLEESVAEVKIFDRLAELLVPRLADWCLIRSAPDGGEEILEVTHVDPEKRAQARRLLLAGEIKTTGPEQVEDERPLAGRLYPVMSEAFLRSAAATPRAYEWLRDLGLGAWLEVPLLDTGGAPLGWLTLASAESGRSLTEGDLALAGEIGRRAGAALELARLYHKAREAVRARDEFISVASHELRTPIMTLLLQCDLFGRGFEAGAPATPETILPRVDRLSRQARRLADLIEQLLDVSRLMAGRIELSPEPCDLVEIADAVARGFAATAPGIVTLRAAGPVRGRWDRARIEQVVENLVSNAIKYGRGQPVDIHVEETEELATITVTDRGIGIPAGERDRVFERFTRAVSPEHYAGLGLGLWLVRETVEAMGGRVTLESEPEAGTTVTVEIPKRAREEEDLARAG